MNAVTFDTHDFIKELESSGFTEEQAEALARAQKKVNEANLEELVTKSDLKEAFTDFKDSETTPIRHEFSEIRSDMRLMKWMLALIIITTVVPALKALLA